MTTERDVILEDAEIARRLIDQGGSRADERAALRAWGRVVGALEAAWAKEYDSTFRGSFHRLTEKLPGLWRDDVVVNQCFTFGLQQTNCSSEDVLVATIKTLAAHAADLQAALVKASAQAPAPTMLVVQDGHVLGKLVPKPKKNAP